VTERPVLHLVDGSGYIFRAYFAIRPLSTRDGVPTNAVFGVARMLGKLVKDERPARLGIAFDATRHTFRHDIYTQYKSNRDEPPNDLVPQFTLVRELVQAMDIPVLELAGYEADDILATLAERAVDAGYDVVLVSGDKDLMQLVSPHVSMFDPMKDKHYGREDVIERFGVPPERVVDVLGLSGDSSDNIPGVPRVGEKTAAKLVAAYGDMEAIIAALSLPGRKLKSAELSIIEFADDARLSKRLASLEYAVPLEIDFDKLRYATPRADKLAPFLRRIEALGLLRDFGFAEVETPWGPESPAAGRGVERPVRREGERPEATTAEATSSAAVAEPRDSSEGSGEDAGGPGADSQQTLPFGRPGTSAGGEAPPESRLARTVDLAPIDRSAYRTIYHCNELSDLVAAARARAEISVDLETTSLDANRAEIVGIALAAGEGPPAYVPVAHRYLGVPKQVSLAQALDYLRPLLADPSVKKVGHNLKYDLLVLARAGVELAGVGDDSMIAAWVLDPSRPSYSLDALAREVLGHETIRYADVTGKGRAQIAFEEVPHDAATRYAAEDADVALRLCHVLSRAAAEANLVPLYREIELPLMPVLAGMERAGIRVDPERLRELDREFVGRLTAIEARAEAAIGAKVNLASPKQLQELLFDKLGLKAEKRTKTGYSTDSDVLEALAREHEVPRIILEHRMISKLKGTYVDALSRLADPGTGRVHTSFNQTGTATGRLSSSDPNLQNIPVRTEDGRRIRAAFVAAPAHVLISADYSQVELRVMAHLSQDPRFIEAFLRGEDIHQRTAQEIITGGLPADAEARRRAKAINFGILYGLSEFGLSHQLGIPRTDASAYIGLYFARYPRIREFLDETIETARQRGFVTTLSGRRRYLPALVSKNRSERQGAERIAMNTPIQGSAADLIKMAMLRVTSALEKRRLRSHLLLQVHDELVLEVPEAEREEVVALVRTEMSHVMELAVPLVVDVGVGHDWATAH
jgi:DNA polymerase-1